MYAGIFAVLLVVGFILFEILSKRAHEEGSFLNNKIKPYHNKISSLLAPYRSTSFSREAMIHSQSILKTLLKEYESYSSQGSLRDDDVCKIVFESPTTDTIDCFAYMYILSKRHNSPLRPSDEEIQAINSLKSFCKDKLKKYDNIPEPFWYYFELRKEDYS